MALFKSKKAAGIPHEGPGQYENKTSDQIIFDRGAKLVVESNLWRLMAFGLLIIAGAAIATRTPPAAQVHAYGVSSDATGHPTTATLHDFTANDQEVRASMADLVMRMWTIEPIFTQDIQHSRLNRNMHSVQAQMIGTASGQFNAWFSAENPINEVVEHPDHSRTVEIVAVNTLEDNTVVVEFVTTESDNVGKPAVTKYAQTFRWQQVQPASDAAFGENPYGVYVAFFQYQKES